MEHASLAPRLLTCCLGLLHTHSSKARNAHLGWGPEQFETRENYAKQDDKKKGLQRDTERQTQLSDQGSIITRLNHQQTKEDSTRPKNFTAERMSLRDQTSDKTKTSGNAPIIIHQGCDRCAAGWQEPQSRHETRDQQSHRKPQNGCSLRHDPNRAQCT